MARPERALSPEEMGLPKKEQKPKLTILKGGKKEDMVQGYSEQDASNLEEGINSLVEQGLLDSDLAQRQIEDIKARTQKVVEPGEARRESVMGGEIILDKVEEKIPEKAEILGKEYERRISYDDIPSMFETLDETGEMDLLDADEIKRQKLELITKLQEQSGWRLLENENLQKLLTEEKFSKDEIKAMIDNVKDSYNPRSDRWTITRNFEEIDKALAAGIISKNNAKQERLQLLSGVENSVRVNLSGARELVEKDLLNAEEFEAMVMDAIERTNKDEKIKTKRKQLGIEPVKISNIERDELHGVINQQLENYQSLLNTKKVNKEERKILAQKKQKMLEIRQEIELNYDVVDINELPGLVRRGEVSAERAKDMLGNDIERTQKNAEAIDKAVRYKELILEDGAVARGYSMIDQLNAAGKLDFGSTDLISLKNEITDLGSKIYQERKRRESKGIFDRMGDYFRTRFTEKGKRETESMRANRTKFAELLQQRASMENKFWSVARMSAEDQEILVKYNIFERKQTQEESELAGIQIFPQQVEKAMKEIMIGKVDPTKGLEKIRKYREIAEKRAEEFAMREFNADQVKKSGDLIEQLYNKNILSFNRANFLEVLARTKSEFTPPVEKVKAREQLLKMELEVYQSINKVSLTELGDALRTFRE